MNGRKNKHNASKGMVMAHAGALLCVLMWGVSFVSTKVLLINGMRPVEIYIDRFLIAYLLILAFRRGSLRSRTWADEGIFLLCGLLSGSMYFLAENFALEYTLVSNVSLLTSTSPLITALLVGIVYREDRPGRGMLIGSTVAFTGVACTIFNSSFSLEINPLGDLLALLAAFSWAIYSMLLKKLNAVYDVWFITRKVFFYGLVTSLPFLLVEPPRYGIGEILTTMPVLVNLLFLGVGASMVAYLLWTATVKQMGAIKANNYLYLQPVVTLVFSVAVLHEAVSWVGYLGCGLILGGLWLGEYLTRRTAMKA